MITMNFTAASFTKISRLLSNLEEAKRMQEDRETLAREMRDEQAEEWSKNFTTGGRYGGYKALSAATVSNRLAKGFNSGPPLVRSGKLALTVSADVIRRGKPQKDGVFWHFVDYPEESDNSAMVAHHTRKEFGRVYLDLQDVDRKMHEQRVEDWLTRISSVVGGGVT